MAQALQTTYQFKLKPADLYAVLIDQQLQYFQYFSKEIQSLKKGTSITRDFYTKINAHAIKGSSRIESLKENESIEIVNKYQNNKIIQTYQIEENEKGSLLTYSEENIFEKAGMQTNYALVSFFYSVIFKWKIRKKFKQLEASLCA